MLFTDVNEPTTKLPVTFCISLNEYTRFQGTVPENKGDIRMSFGDKFDEMKDKAKDAAEDAKDKASSDDDTNDDKSMGDNLKDKASDAKDKAMEMKGRAKEKFNK